MHTKAAVLKELRLTRSDYRKKIPRGFSEKKIRPAAAFHAACELPLLVRGVHRCSNIRGHGGCIDGNANAPCSVVVIGFCFIFLRWLEQKGWLPRPPAFVANFCNGLHHCHPHGGRAQRNCHGKLFFFPERQRWRMGGRGRSQSHKSNK